MWIRSTRCESTHCLEWRKASYSAQYNCVEFRTSSHSAENGCCVEVSTCHCHEVEPVAQVRDSKDPTGPILSFDAGSWRALTAAMKGGWRG